MTRVLVTNDDGIDSPGLHGLADVARAEGFEVVVAAPSWDTSGASASITGVEHDGRLRSNRRPGHHTYAVDASPAMITLVALRGAFGPPPDLVLSGINRGRNTGHAVLHSGTVGAALTASLYGVSSLAVSIDAANPSWWETAAVVAVRLVRQPGALRASRTLNLNVPDRPHVDLAGVRVAPLARVGAVQTNVTDPGRGYLQVTFEGPPMAEPETDGWYLDRGFAVLTALDPVCVVDQPDLVALAATESDAMGGTRTTGSSR